MKAPGKTRPPKRRRGFGDAEAFAAAGTRSDHVQSLVRALGAINQLASAEDGMTLTNMRNAWDCRHRPLTGCSQPWSRSATCISITSIGSGQWGCGRSSPAPLPEDARNLVGIARPYVRALMNESTETVNLAIEDRTRGRLSGAGRVPPDDTRLRPARRADNPQTLEARHDNGPGRLNDSPDRGEGRCDQADPQENHLASRFPHRPLRDRSRRAYMAVGLEGVGTFVCTRENKIWGGDRPRPRGR